MKIGPLLPPSLAWLDYWIALGLLCLSNLVFPIAFPLPIEAGGHWKEGHIVLTCTSVEGTLVRY